MATRFLGKRIFSRFLDTNGDGTGTKNANGDYSAAPVEFFIQPGPEQNFALKSMTVSIVDQGAVDAGRYGNNITLTNGISVSVQNATGVIFELTDPAAPIKRNADWAQYCTPGQPLEYGQGTNHIPLEWDFTQKAAQLIQLDGLQDERLVVTLHDDFSGLVEHRFIVQGHDPGDDY